ncbi:MAG: hypothetical protein ACU0GG_14815 [Paracoccaceae bacterium]
MSRSNGFLSAGVFLAFTCLFGALPWLAGGFYIDTHEGDAYHLLDVLTRMQRGDVPHIDFVTPLGALSFWPILWVMQTGQSVGAAFMLAQAGVALAMVPLLAYAAGSRLPRAVGLAFGLVTLSLVLSLSYGTATAGVGISMHYNRWAWGVAFLMLVLSFVPAQRPRPLLDGALIGLLAAALLLLKVTYFVALVPTVALALWQMHGVRGFVAATLGGLAIAVAVTVLHGLGFWLGYLNDLRVVSSSEIRPFVGMRFNEIVANPTHIGATLAGIAAILLLRRALPGAGGYAALLLIPGCLYITFQNFGNDPQWLLVLPTLLLALRPRLEGQVIGIEAQKFASVTALSAAVLIFPSFANTLLSPISHLSLDKSAFLPMVPEQEGLDDVYIRRDRAFMMTAQVFRDQEPGPWSVYEAQVDRPEIAEFAGVMFPNCEWMAGSRAYFETLSADMVAGGIPPGSRLMTADLLAAFWFFGPFAPPENSAPWYYGGLTGIENTDFILVPKCAFTSRVRNIILDEMAASKQTFTLVRDTELLAVFRVGGEQVANQ